MEYKAAYVRIGFLNLISGHQITGIELVGLPCTSAPDRWPVVRAEAIWVLASLGSLEYGVHIINSVVNTPYSHMLFFITFPCVDELW